MASTEATNGNVFSMGDMLTFYNKERDKSVRLGCYNGAPEITLNDGYKKGVAPKKVKLNYAQLNLVIKTLERLVKNPGPNISAPLKFTKGERDSDGKYGKFHVYFILQFSTDDKSVFHIAAKHIGDDEAQVSCMAAIRTTGVESELIPDQAAASLNAAEGLLRWMRCVWMNAASFTRNNMFIPNRNKGKNNSSSNSSSGDLLNFDTPANPPSEDNMPF